MLTGTIAVLMFASDDSCFSDMLFFFDLGVVFSVSSPSFSFRFEPVSLIYDYGRIIGVVSTFSSCILL